MKTRLLTTEEAAEQLGTTPQHIRRLIRRGQLRAKRKGERAWDVDASSVERYERRRRPAGRPVGTVSTEVARSTRFGVGTREAERERQYQREYRRDRRAKGLS